MIGSSVLGRETMQGLALLAAALVLGGCTSKPEPAEPAPRPTETAEAAAESAPQPRRQRIIDPQGRLIPSDDFLAGVRLPRGMELVREEALLHVYHIRAPIEKVLGYFGPMLITGTEAYSDISSSTDSSKVRIMIRST